MPGRRPWSCSEAGPVHRPLRRRLTLCRSRNTVRSPRPAACRRSRTSDITASKPEKSPHLAQGDGRPHAGRQIAVRHRGAGAKQLSRVVDFVREVRRAGGREDHRVRSGPRSAHRPRLLQGRREALHPRSGRPQARPDRGFLKTEAEIQVGNRLSREKIPVGMAVHAVEPAPGRAASSAVAPATSCGSSRSKAASLLPASRPARCAWS